MKITTKEIKHNKKIRKIKSEDSEGLEEKEETPISRLIFLRLSQALYILGHYKYDIEWLIKLSKLLPLILNSQE